METRKSCTGYGTGKTSIAQVIRKNNAPCIQDKNVVHIEDLNINSLYDILQNIAADNQHKTLNF